MQFYTAWSCRIETYNNISRDIWLTKPLSLKMFIKGKYRALGPLLKSVVSEREGQETIFSARIVGIGKDFMGKCILHDYFGTTKVAV